MEVEEGCLLVAPSKTARVALEAAWRWDMHGTVYDVLAVAGVVVVVVKDIQML